MTKKSRRNNKNKKIKRNNKSKKGGIGKQMTSQIGKNTLQMGKNALQMGDQLSSQMGKNTLQMGDQLSSQMGKNALQMGDQLSSQMGKNVLQMGDQLSSQMGKNALQMGDQLSSQIGQQLSSRLGENILHVGEQLSSELGNEVLGIINDIAIPAYNDFLSTGIDAVKKIALKEFKLRAEQLKIANEAAEKLIGTSKKLQHRAVKTSDIIEKSLDNILQPYQQGGKKITQRVENSKKEFISSEISSELPLNLMMDIPI
jgi:hypothetical protein